MADRRETLTVVKGGIDRLRTRGGALRDHLYDLLNGYVTTEKTVVGRPGTFREAVLPSSDTTGASLTQGMVSANGVLNVFSAEEFSADMPDGFVQHLIVHPARANESGAPIRIKRIHYSQLFMGFLYVVAEFEEPDHDTGFDTHVFHYWLQTGDVWEADKAYRLGDIVTPTVPNGFSYRATRLTAAFPSWAPNVQRVAGTFGDVIEPTIYNDFFYTAVDSLGDNPRSGEVEPDWPEEDGARINEDAEGAPDQQAVPTAQPDPVATPDPNTQDRYGSPGEIIP